MNMKQYRSNRYRKEIRKEMGLVLTGALLFGAAPAMAAEETGVGFALCDEYINVRSEAGTDGEVIGKLYSNGKVEILETSEDGSWYHIRSGNVDGYVSSDLIATGEEADEIAQSAGYTTAECGAYALNVHASKDDDSEVVGTLFENKKYEVVDDQGDWVKVVTGDGTYGWVSCDYVYTTTEYGEAETLEEEQARLDAQWLAYLDTQELNDTAEAAQAWDEADAREQEAYEARSQADKQAAYAAQAQETADASYQEYLNAQAAAQAAGSSEDTSAQAAADEAWQTYEEAQSAADEQAQSAAHAEETADAAYQSYQDAQYAAEQAQSAADTQYTDDTQYASQADSYSDESQGSAEDACSGTTDAAAATSGSSTGQSVANYACQFVGNPYVYGGSSLTNGADCSGFVMSVYANFGVSLPHNAAAQSGYGTAVDASSLAPGDLVFYSDGSGISHVAIYIGGGSIVHAANSASGICYGNVNYNTPVAYRRLV